MKTITVVRATVFFCVLIICMSCELDFSGEVLEDTTVETIVADFPANDGLSVDRAGKVYASNFSGFAGTQLIKTDPRNGAFETITDALVAPTGNAVDLKGNIYVANNVRFVDQQAGTTEGDIVKIADDGSLEVLATLPGFPAGVTLDKKGNVYVSNFSFPAVHKITPEGEVSIFVQDARLAGGVGIDFDYYGNLFVGNFSTGEILKIRNGVVEVLATVPTTVTGFVIGYITYLGGSIFATGISDHKIYRISGDGDVSVFAGNGQQATVDGSLEDASFNQPNGIAADKLRKIIYISELAPDGALRAIKLE